MSPCPCRQCYEIETRYGYMPEQHGHIDHTNIGRMIDVMIDVKLKEAKRAMAYGLQQQMQYNLRYALSTIVDDINGKTVPNGLDLIVKPVIKQSISEGDKKMNIVTYAKLNKNQRTLYKVGIVDTDGHLTSEGRNVVLDMLAADASMQTKLVDIAKEYKKDQKED